MNILLYSRLGAVNTDQPTTILSRVATFSYTADWTRAVVSIPSQVKNYAYFRINFNVASVAKNTVNVYIDELCFGESENLPTCPGIYTFLFTSNHQVVTSKTQGLTVFDNLITWKTDISNPEGKRTFIFVKA